MITRSRKSSIKDDKPKTEPKRKERKPTQIEKEAKQLKKNESKVDKNEVEMPKNVKKHAKKAEDKEVKKTESTEAVKRSKRLREAQKAPQPGSSSSKEVDKRQKDVVEVEKDEIGKHEDKEVGKPNVNVSKEVEDHDFCAKTSMEIAKPDKEVAKADQSCVKKAYLMEPKGDPKPQNEDVYEFDEIDENVPHGKKRKRKVLKITKIRAKKANNEANMIKKAEINVRTNVHIKHKKTLTDYEKLEIVDINKKMEKGITPLVKVRKTPLVKIERPLRTKKLNEVQAVPIKKATPLKVLDQNVQSVRTSQSFSSPMRSPMNPILKTPVRTSMQTVYHTPIIDFPLPSPSSDISSCDVYASTPVKYSIPVIKTKFDVSNCFGFDGEETLPDLSPSKELKIEKKAEEPKKDVLSAQEVIKKLRFELNEPDTIEEEAQNSDFDSTRIDEVAPPEPESPLGVYDPTVPEAEIPVRLPRRSYERSFKPRKKKVIAGLVEDDEVSSDDEIQTKKYTKKKAPPKEKKNPAMDKWIEEFNKHCKEVEKFNLCVE